MANYDNLTAAQMRKATEQLKEMEENHKKYGLYVLNKDIPEATTRQDLYNRLELSNVYEDIAAKQKEFEAEIQRVSKDKRYKTEFKDEYKKKMQEEFIKYKTDKLTEVKEKLNGYKTDLQEKYSYKVEDKNLEAIETNSSLLTLAMLDTIEGNTELMKQFVENNWHRKDVMSLVQAKYKDNAEITTQIAEKRRDEARPYELVNKCLNDVTTFINNKDYNVNADYIENGIKSFDPIE